jgi:hypothetical protein
MQSHPISVRLHYVHLCVPNCFSLSDFLNKLFVCISYLSSNGYVGSCFTFDNVFIMTILCAYMLIHICCPFLFSVRLKKWKWLASFMSMRSMLVFIMPTTLFTSTWWVACTNCWVLEYSEFALFMTLLCWTQCICILHYSCVFEYIMFSFFTILVW